MTVRNYSVVSDRVGVKVVKWSGLENGDTGQWYEWADAYPDKCFHVFGTFGTGGSVSLEGTCEEVAAPEHPLVLNDTTGLPLTKTAEALKQVAESPTQMRPNVTAGDANTSLTVYLTMRS